MRLLGSINVISCQQIDQTLAFYQQALQFVIHNQRYAGDELAWVHLRSGDVAIMLERADAGSANASGHRMYLYVDNVPDLHHFLKAKQFQPDPLRQTDYGATEFDIVDPEGMRITLGQSDSDENTNT